MRRRPYNGCRTPVEFIKNSGAMGIFRLMENPDRTLLS